MSDRHAIESHSREAVLAELERILVSPQFQEATRLKAFLTYLVQRTLAGEGHRLKEYTIGVDVFERREDFDPKIDSIVRAQASRLRAKLAEFYGQSAPSAMAIVLPKRGYVPEFVETPSALSDARPQAAHGRGARWSSRVALAAAVLCAVVAVGWYSVKKSLAPNDLRIERVAGVDGVTFGPAISRDGKMLAYVSDRAERGNLDLYVQQVGGQPIRLTTTAATETLPDFSPDGTSLVFQRFNGVWELFVISALGGEERKLTPGVDARYSPDGKWIAYAMPKPLSEVYVIPAVGGKPQRVGASLRTAMSPTWSHDGRHLMVLGFGKRGPVEKEFDFWVVPIAGGAPKRTGLYLALRQKVGPEPLEAFNLGSWDADFLYLFGGQRTVANVYRVRFGGDTLQPEGELERMTNGAQRIGFMKKAGNWMVFSTPTANQVINGVQLNGNGTGSIGEPARLTSEPAVTGFPVLSPDGSKLAYAAMRRGNDQDVWVTDIGSARARKVVATPEAEWPLGFSSDGQRVAYIRGDAAHSAPVGGGEEQTICEKCCLFDISMDWTRIVTCPSEGATALMVRNLKSSTDVPVVALNGPQLAGFRLSPNGRWIAFFTVSQHMEASSVYVVPVPATRSNAKVPNVAELQPVLTERSQISGIAWSPAGDKLFFKVRRDGYPCVWVQALSTENMRGSGEPTEVVHSHTAMGAIAKPAQGSMFNDLSAAKHRIAYRFVDGESSIWMATMPR